MKKQLLILSFFISLSLVSFSQISFSVGTTPTGLPSAGISVLIRWSPFDYDGDGDIDVLYQLGNVSGADIYYLENNGSGTYTSTAATGGTFNSGPLNGLSFTLIVTGTGTPLQQPADYDNDGDIDIFELGSSSSRLLKNNNGSWSVASLPTNFPTSVVAPLRWVTGDFNNDGDVDVLYQNVNTPSTGIFYLDNDGSGNFTSTAATSGTFSSGPFNGITFSLIGGASVQYVDDYDGDGDKDIFELSTSASRFLVNNGNGTWSVSGSLPTNFPSVVNNANRWLPADYDGDGDKDILYQSTSSSGSGIFYLQNNGSGSYTSIAATSGTFASGPFNGVSFTLLGFIGNPIQHIMDLDNDGDFDILELTPSATRAIFASGTAPAITSSTPADNSNVFSVASNIVLNFNQAVTAGSGNIYIRRSSDNSIVHTIAANGAAVSGSGTSTITIDPPANLDLFASYYLTFDRYAFTNANGVIFATRNHFEKTLLPITSPSYLNFSTSTTMPVSLLAFTAVLQENGDVLLNWQTASESNNSHFIVERSYDAVNFENITRINAAGNTTGTVSYSYTDKTKVTGKVYYRLIQFDIDGRKKDLGIKTIHAGQAIVKAFPNPAATAIKVQIPASNSPVQIRLVNNIGQLVFSKLYTASSVITIPTDKLRNGLYTLVISGKDIQQMSKRIAIQ